MTIAYIEAGHKNYFSFPIGPLGAKLQFDDIWAILKVKTFPAMVGPWLMTSRITTF